MDLNHLHVLVKDLNQSKKFYADLFGFKEKAEYGPELLFLQNANGFDLALTPVNDVPKLPDGIHYGFSVKNKEIMTEFYNKGRKLYPALFSNEPKDHGSWGSFSCLDPNGYVVEIYWDSQLHEP